MVMNLMNPVVTQKDGVCSPDNNDCNLSHGLTCDPILVLVLVLRLLLK
jgi:hypothetical protein